MEDYAIPLFTWTAMLGAIWLIAAIFDIRGHFAGAKEAEPYETLPWSFSIGYAVMVMFLAVFGDALLAKYGNDLLLVIVAVCGSLFAGFVLGEFSIRKLSLLVVPEAKFYPQFSFRKK